MPASAAAVVTVEGLDFRRERTERARGVSYVAIDDGTKLRSTADVSKYLAKCGLEAALPAALDRFNFDLCVVNGVGHSGQAEVGALQGGREPRSAEETPVKDCQKLSRETAGAQECDATVPSLDRAGKGKGVSGRGKAAARDAGADGLDKEEPEFRRRNRAIAQSRAADFAMGRGFVDDADREAAGKKRTSDASGGHPRGGKRGRREKESVAVTGVGEDSMREDIESWPGPWSTASELYTKRDAAVEARKCAGAGAGGKIVHWEPKKKGLSAKKSARSPLPTLQSMCIDMVATHIDACQEGGLGAILPDMKAKLCENLCGKRKLLPNVLPLFTDGETAVLSLPDCSYIGEQDMATAFQRCQGPALEVLSLKSCGRSMSDKLLADLCANSPNLHTLQLGGCYRVSDKGIASAVKALPRLRVLELSDCRNISAEALKSVAAVGATLESLYLKNCTQLDSEALLQLERLQHLKRLSLSGCRGASDVIVEMVVGACGASLEELDLSHLPDSGFSAEPVHCRIGDTSLQCIAAKCANLRILRLQNCDTITDLGVQALAAGVCKQLTHLDFTRCKSLSDDALEPLITNCRALSHLSLNAASSVEFDAETGESTHGITDRSLVALRKHAATRLRELDLSWCRGVTDDGLGHLVDHAYELEALSLRGCAQITEMFLNGHSNTTVKVHGRRLEDSTLRVVPKGWTSG